MTEHTKLTHDRIAELASTVRAPESLHRSVQAMVDAAGEREAGHRRLRWPSPRLPLSRAWPAPVWPAHVRLARVGALGALGAALAGVAVALSLALSGGSSGGLSVEQAAALTLRSPTMGAPRESRANHTQLQASVEGVAFPYWRDRFGWRSAGARMDRVAGRSAMTVFYADTQGHQIGYAIVSGRAPRLSGGTIRWSAETPYRVSHQGGATVVAWPRGGHLCVISGRGMTPATLLRLAGWREPMPASA